MRGLKEIIFLTLIFISFMLSYINPLIAVIFYILILTSGIIILYSDFRSHYLLLLSVISVIIITLIYFALLFSLNITSEEHLFNIGNRTGTLSFTEALYFSTITLTTLGYGDITPHGYFRALSAIESILGFIFLGLLVSVFTSILIRRQNQKGR
jgi:hypothetical protein